MPRRYEQSACGKAVSKKVRNRVLGFFAIVTVVLGSTLWLSATYFFYYGPTAPNPASGRVYHIDVHGRVIYLTYCEYLISGPLMFWAMSASIALLMLLIAVLGNPSSDR